MTLAPTLSFLGSSLITKMTQSLLKKPSRKAVSTGTSARLLPSSERVTKKRSTIDTRNGSKLSKQKVRRSTKDALQTGRCSEINLSKSGMATPPFLPISSLCKDLSLTRVLSSWATIRRMLTELKSVYRTSTIAYAQIGLIRSYCQSTTFFQKCTRTETDSTLVSPKSKKWLAWKEICLSIKW